MLEEVQNLPHKERTRHMKILLLLEETSKIRHEDWLSTTKDTSSGRGLSTTKAEGPLRHNSFSNPEPEYRGYPEKNGRGLDPRKFGPFVDDENDSFETIRTDVPPSNEPSIPQSNVHLSNDPVIHLSNEPVLTNVPPLNEPMLTNVPLSIELEPIIGQSKTSAEFRFEPQSEQVKDLLDFWFKSAAYKEDPYDFSKEFNIDTESLTKIPIHMFIEELRRIYSEMSYTYMEEAEMSQARLTPWAMNYCESRKFVADSLTCRVRTPRHHFQMTSYGRTDYVNIEDGTCSYRWWQTMGLPCEHRVRTLGLANVDPTTPVSEYYTNNTYKTVYVPIWIPIRGIK
ncbi:hypothetical protein GIB67_016214 [Kingdonia uniflora]|uniref:SWIM-type domain-containing protein n=1 Tax=Kingdonia uniflora TaxID=39325 RepID=A0A7J7LSX7_9MAGN|nr:hypothetical protein GIB67_016214 [Kingdonia uniflora]